jgi:hypothetical protein
MREVIKSTIIQLLSPAGNTNQKIELIWTPGYTRGGMGYPGGVNVSCRPVTSDVTLNGAAYIQRLCVKDGVTIGLNHMRLQFT